MSSYKDHNYLELMLDFEDKDIYEQNKDICILQKVWRAKKLSGLTEFSFIYYD